MLESLADVQCPSCFEYFSFTLPQISHETAVGEVEMDYDCEVCCRPMRIIVTNNGTQAHAIGMDD